MMRGQVAVAFIAKLQELGVEPEVITEAVNEVLDIQLGESITGEDELVRAFSFEQAQRLEKVR